MFVRLLGIPIYPSGEPVKTQVDWFNIGTFANATDMIPRAYALAAKIENGVYGRYPIIKVHRRQTCVYSTTNIKIEHFTRFKKTTHRFQRKSISPFKVSTFFSGW
jgi:hypothetical protein